MARFDWSLVGEEICGVEGAIVLDRKIAAVIGD
jgi:hypothetical protein